MKLTILTDDPRSWYVSHAKNLAFELTEGGHEVRLVFAKTDLEPGDVCFLLSCSKLVEGRYLSLNRNNIVVHASDLPAGRGFSPLQWQIVEGKNEITLTLFEAVEAADAGPYYFKETLAFEGTELLEEMRQALGVKINAMCVKYVREIDRLRAISQTGEPSFYRRRGLEDDRLDPDRTIVEQFDHLRIADNDRHPLFFDLRGSRYYLRIARS